MPSITFDGHAFQLEGRRIWLVSGSISYVHVPRASWSEAIHAAKQAGLNCIETTVVWARHEPRQGQFDFTGDNDLRHFIELVHQAGLHCILRIGPYVGMGLDLGGLPAWLLGLPNVRLRTNSQPFLEACSRYINAVSAQVRDLQATNAGGGPIILLQLESSWTCGDDTLAHSYLGELHRYLREAGMNVPVINSNDLWQGLESEIDGWTGFENLLPHLRQLAAVKPNQPRMVIEFRVAEQATFNRPAPARPTPDEIVRHLAECLAAGAQFNIHPFCGGTTPGFLGGRLTGSGDAFITPSRDGDLPVLETGRRGEAFAAVRRVCTFASHFSRLFSNLDPRRHAVMVHPGASGGGVAPTRSASVVHTSGSQGGIVFVFAGARDDAGAGKSRSKGEGQSAAGGEIIPLLLSDGSTLTVPLGDLPVVWCLVDTRLTGRAHLDYTNLSAMAMVGRVLVLFGPPGSHGVVSINGSRMEVTVPEGDAPHVQEHEGVTVVVGRPEHLPHIAWNDQNVYIGALGVDREGRVIPLADNKNYTRLGADGSITTVRSSPVLAGRAGASGGGSSVAAPGRAQKIALSEWTRASTGEYSAGDSARYATIPGPADLVALGAPYGYGWYRLKFAASSARKVAAAFPHANHRLHIWLDGAEVGVAGLGPGAETEIDLPLKKREQTLVILAENFGRLSGGADMGEQTGLWGHIWEVSPNRVGKPKLIDADPVDLLALKSPLWCVHKDDTSDPRRLQWTVPHRGKNPLLMKIGDVARAGPGVIIVNGKPTRFFQQGGGMPIALDPAMLTAGKNTIEISLVGSTEEFAADLARAVGFMNAEDNLTEKAEWAFAKWEPPGADAFAAAKPGGKGAGAKGGAAWWRSTFRADPAGDLPVFLDAAGLTKGQIYVNGRHVSRYFVATADGKRVPPQALYLIPRSFLHGGDANEISIFDEHGAAPTKVRLLADASLSTMSD